MTNTLTTATNSREQLERDTAETLVRQRSGPPATQLDATTRAKNYQRLLKILPAYSDETLHRFAATAMTDLSENLNSYLCNAHPTEEFINDWITVQSTATKGRIDVSHLIYGLGEYKNLEPQTKGNYPSRRIEQITAITTASATLWETGNGITFGVNTEQDLMLFITDGKLRDMLTTHENPSAIADIVASRSITDPDQIIALYDLMEKTANAIANGTL